MARVIYIGDPTLRKVATRVTQFNQELRDIAKLLVNTMYMYKGLGLAANQISIDKAICVIDVSKEQNKAEIYINPKILALQDERPYSEGCLSLPGVQATTKRATKVEVQYQDLQGTVYTVWLDGLKAIAMQHECDHLEGRLFIDQFGNMQQVMLVDKHKKYIKAITRRNKF